MNTTLNRKYQCVELILTQKKVGGREGKASKQASRATPHGLYKLEKVLNFSSRLEKSLNSVKVLEKYLISLLGLEKSLKFSNLLRLYHFSEKLNDFAEKKLCIDDE